MHSCPSLRGRRESLRGVKKRTEGIGRKKKGRLERQVRSPYLQGERQVRLGEGPEKESWQPAQKDRSWDNGLLSSSVRKIPVFFLGCLVSWLKISEPNGALGTERWRGM